MNIVKTTALVFLGLLGATAAYAADEYNTATGLTAAGAPLGLHGVDPVAFIDLGNRIDGTATYTAVHDGVAYYFTSEANKQAFEGSPSSYLPQFGGFCTFGVSVAKKFDGDPRYAAVRNGKLYVFLNEAIFTEFQKDRAGTIAKAEKNWRKIEHTEAGSL
ncbi:YHS domain-containing (seleno)protein [Lentisalinibacter salinarum]|uniref:YHS domain-containing (seleno)protein n=1 Tax=Lentisalinibacter salinarum TaxID=2992239 RepID=UPI00386BE8BE